MGVTFVLAPLEIQKAVCLALGLGTGGRYDVGLAIPGQKGGLLREVCFRSLERDTHTLFFFFTFSQDQTGCITYRYSK